MAIFVGIDVAKEELEIAVSNKNKVYAIKNTPKSCKKEAEKLLKIMPELVVLESTGGYEMNFVEACWEVGVKVSIANPKKCRSFAEAQGRKAKTDKIDAKTICKFAETFSSELKKTAKPSDNHRKLNDLVRRRDQIIQLVVAEKNRRQQARSEESKQSICVTLVFLNGQLKEIEKKIADCIDSDEHFKDIKNKLLPIKGVGKVTIAALLCFLPELGSLDKKQVAALSGLAPYNNDSGKFKGVKSIAGGRMQIRNALYMAILSAIRSKGWVYDKYNHLLSKGKKRKVAMIACMRSLLVKINAMIAGGNEWVEPVFVAE